MMIPRMNMCASEVREMIYIDASIRLVSKLDRNVNGITLVIKLVLM